MREMKRTAAVERGRETDDEGLMQREEKYG